MTQITKNQIRAYDPEKPVRLNKFLSDAGYCSRRQADRLIENGDVRIDGEVASLGSKVLPGQAVEVGGKILMRSSKLILLAYHKPLGIECTTAQDNPDNIVDHIGYPERIYPIGRLDKNSTGLLLLTNTGELVNAILKSVNEHEKEYEVTVDKPVTEDFLNGMRSGVFLEELDVTTRKCKVTQTGTCSFRIVLTQGLNRQIRRMCSAFGYQVVRLHRIRIMNILLGDLKEDHYRDVNKEEFDRLLKDLEM